MSALDGGANSTNLAQAITDFISGIQNQNPAVLAQGVLELDALKNGILAATAGASESSLVNLGLFYVDLTDLTSATLALQGGDLRQISDAFANIKLDIPMVMTTLGIEGTLGGKAAAGTGAVLFGASAVDSVV